MLRIDLRVVGPFGPNGPSQRAHLPFDCAFIGDVSDVGVDTDRSMVDGERSQEAATNSQHTAVAGMEYDGDIGGQKSNTGDRRAAFTELLVSRESAGYGVASVAQAHLEVL